MSSRNLSKRHELASVVVRWSICAVIACATACLARVESVSMDAGADGGAVVQCRLTDGGLVTVHPETDPENCGGCGIVCPSGACADGICTCGAK